MSRPYNCDICGMDLKRVGKVEITKKLMYKTLIVTKEEKWKCPTGCELKSINVNLNKSFSESLKGESQ